MSESRSVRCSVCGESAEIEDTGERSFCTGEGNTDGTFRPYDPPIPTEVWKYTAKAAERHAGCIGQSITLIRGDR